MKDGINFATENIPALFKKMFFPTVLGMMISSLFVITDGAFVGRGVGSDALAAVNIVSPIWLLASGIGLMFGMGGSVVASIQLSRGKVKTARINMTQSILVSSLFIFLNSILILVFLNPILQFLGCSERLLPYARAYSWGFIPFMTFNALICSGEFFVRLSGAPKYAMLCSILSSVLNIILDYLFIFVFRLGVFGAAMATSIGSVVSAVMIIAYLSRQKSMLHFIRIKTHKRSRQLTVRNVGYMCKLGLSSFLCETAVSCMMLCGNFVFMRCAHEDGVAAFSIACYFFPIIYMLYNSIAMSAQPIISFNYGSGAKHRVKMAFSLSVKVALACGIVICLLTAAFSRQIVSLFIAEDFSAFAIASKGFPLFALGFIPFAVNIVTISYLQSVELTKKATVHTILRGFVFMVVSFFALSRLFGINGAWLAVPASETMTFIVLVCLCLAKKKHDKALRQAHMLAH
jgi:Na+-driven multidrug efflux pump